MKLSCQTRPACGWHAAFRRAPTFHNKVPTFHGAPTFLLAAVLVSILLLNCGCSFYKSSVTLSVGLPPFPDHWQTTFPDLCFRVVYPVPNLGGFAELLVDGRDRPVIDLSKTLYLPVLAYPNLPDRSLELPPAGGVYPLDCDDPSRSIDLSWEQGAVAEVLRRLWIQGNDCSAINGARLAREMSERCQGDPWALDLTRICVRLASGEFRVTHIRPAASRDLRLEPGPGRWFLESPFREPVSAATDGSLLLESVPLGTHCLYESSSASRYLLYVQDEVVLVRR
ncbi:MAG: hypothetical protein JSV89_22580 [Spirochaetaceae bacterium]|nr:MAG: hypothetical protein JSV89_22580 [Spirochaetaceae bacterium]